MYRDYKHLTTRNLISVDVSKAILDMRVHNKFSHPQDLTTQMEGVTESTFLSLLGGECLDRFQVEVVVQVKIVEVLSVDQEVQHVVPLSTNLQMGRD